MQHQKTNVIGCCHYDVASAPSFRNALHQALTMWMYRKRFTPTWVIAEVSGLLFDWHLVEQRCTRRPHVLQPLLIVTGIHHFLFESLGRHWCQRLWHLALIRGAPVSGKMATGLRAVSCLTVAIGLWEWQTGLGKLPMEPSERERQKIRNYVRWYYSQHQGQLRSLVSW